MGTLHKGPDQPLLPQSFQLKRLGKVGGYAIQPVWGDGHASGIFSFEYLRRTRRTSQGEPASSGLAAESHEIVDVQKIEPGADIFAFGREFGLQFVEELSRIQIGRHALFLQRRTRRRFRSRTV